MDDFSEGKSREEGGKSWGVGLGDASRKEDMSGQF